MSKAFKKIIFIILNIIVTLIFFICFDEIFYQKISEDTIPKYIYLFVCLESSFVINSLICTLFLPLIHKIENKIIAFRYRKTIDFTYYRDIIKTYSISTLCYCYNKKVNYRDQIVATLLCLELDGKIKHTTNGIQIINNDHLSQTETNLLKSLTETPIYTKENIHNKIKLDNKSDFYASDLYQEKWSELTNFLIIISLILYVINFIILINTNELIFAIILISLFILLLLRLNFEKKPCLSINEKGLEIQAKLIGLNMFLQDFSNINNRKLSEIMIWEYYIIFAIIFNNRGILNEEAKELYLKYYNLLESNIE